MENTEIILREVLSHFALPGTFCAYETITLGNINSTYKVICDDNGAAAVYVVQKINTFVFKEPEQIMTNIDAITSHINRKRADGHPQLVFYHTRTDGKYYLDGESNFWRVYNYIDSVTFNTCDDLELLRSAGEAFGEFQNALSDFEADMLYETISDFHNTRKRLDRLFADAAEDVCGRAVEVAEELTYLRSMYATATRLTEQMESGELPMRVTHNDTKMNNVLFEKETHRPLVVVDLDTVMPGLAAYDFGDAVRFAANTAEEDEKDVQLVALDLEKYRAFAEGYIAQIANSLTDAELDSMALGALTITLELASRFLDDYITGDQYFKTDYAGHNLVRARCQLALARDMARKFDQMEQIVHLVADGIRACVRAE